MKTAQQKTDEPFKITKDWTDTSKKMKQKFARLTDADLKLETGKEEDLLKRIGSRLNKKRQEVIDIIKEG